MDRRTLTCSLAGTVGALFLIWAIGTGRPAERLPHPAALSGVSALRMEWHQVQRLSVYRITSRRGVVDLQPAPDAAVDGAVIRVDVEAGGDHLTFWVREAAPASAPR